ncbi:hypothetical protein QN277_022980 [Acacia crassicarpa]|uniref:Uncharacterized protein n=1 Tax=Acacia crassicarpa TaxID=499986 RepID=A0AAE1JK72_9FABA|nr:hypothetical protein QN277_022980 [Acacia crassicarpa]
MGNSQSQEHKMNTKLYKWSSGEFRNEYALIYTASGGGLYSPRSCTFYYRVSCEKLVITMDDDLCSGRRVRVNMEFVAVRDDKSMGFKFGPVKFKDSGPYFHQRRRRSSKEEVLFLQYFTDLYGGRRTQLCLNKVRKKQRYLVIFHTAIGNSDDNFSHYMTIKCDPSKGIEVNLCGPYHDRAGERELCDTENISGMPPDDIIDNAEAIRNDLKVEDGNSVGPTPPNVYNIIHNRGIIEGDGNGSINNK